MSYLLFISVRPETETRRRAASAVLKGDRTPIEIAVGSTFREESRWHSRSKSAYNPPLFSFGWLSASDERPFSKSRGPSGTFARDFWIDASPLPPCRPLPAGARNTFAKNVFQSGRRVDRTDVCARRRGSGLRMSRGPLPHHRAGLPDSPFDRPAAPVEPSPVRSAPDGVAHRLA